MPVTFARPLSEAMCSTIPGADARGEASIVPVPSRSRRRSHARGEVLDRAGAEPMQLARPPSHGVAHNHASDVADVRDGVPGHVGDEPMPVAPDD